MDDSFKIYIDRLNVGDEEVIEETFNPDFMEIDEKELSFPFPIHVFGKAYLTKEDLFLDFSLSTFALMPCAICNEMSKVPIKIEHFSHTENLKDIHGGIFNFKNLIREALLLELPLAIKCQGDNCPEQEYVLKYMKKNKGDEEKRSFHPFADL